MSGTFDSLEELNEIVGDGLASVPMWEVRDAYGQERLGVHVRTGIHKALARLGLGHFPEQIPDRQGEMLRVYRLGSPTAALIEAVLAPGEEGDELIRDAVGGDAAATLTKIREMVEAAV